MARESIMTTYKNMMMMHKSFDRAKSVVTADPAVVAYAQLHGKREAYLYNNRIFFGYINPSPHRKAEYDANWRYINSL